MYELINKTVTMTLKEFKEWEVPKGWSMRHMSGNWVYPAISAIPGVSNDRYFEIRVVLEKEK